MKYLLFNVAVAAALVFLFTADRGEVQKIAGQVHDAAGDMKDYANKMLHSAKKAPDRAATKSVREAEPAPVAAPPRPLETPSVTKPQPSPQPPPKPEISRQLAANLPEMPDYGPETGKAAPVPLHPEVAKRRKEILQGIDTAAAVDSAPALKDGTRLMTASERRKELLSLAEEMELLYARSISR